MSAYKELLAKEPDLDEQQEEFETMTETKTEALPNEEILNKLPTMSASEMTKLTKEYDIVIEGFMQMKLTDKRAALIKHFSGDSTAEPVVHVDTTPPTESVVKAKVESTPGVPPTAMTEHVAEPEIVPASNPIVAFKMGLAELNEEKAAVAAKSLVEGGEQNDYRLGGVLSLMQKNSWFGGYDTLQDFVTNELGFKYRKAMYLIAVFDGVEALNLPYSKFIEIGWTKTVNMVDILTPENVDEWIEKAKGVTVMQLQELVKAHKLAQQNQTALPAPQETNPVTTFTVKLHEDQKEMVKAAIDRVMELTGTEVKAVALTHICTDYMAGPTNKPQVVEKVVEKIVEKPVEKIVTKTETVIEKVPLDLLSTFKELGIVKVLEAFQEVWPDVDLELDNAEKYITQ